jgi:hypothetical protein
MTTTEPESIDIGRMRELAERATPGPWCVEDPMDFELAIVEAGKQSYEWRFIASCSLPESDDDQAFTGREVHANAAYIAAANPKTILALLAELETLRGSAGPSPDKARIAELEAKSASVHKEYALCRKLLIERCGELQAAEAKLADAEGDRDDFRDRLHDLVMIDSEEWATGGGPGFADRKKKAWDRAREPFEP